MNESEFKKLIQRGLGGAILYARHYDVSAFRNVILDACLRCYAIDPQSEGTRAAYMLELTECTADKVFYCDQVLESLHGGGDDWHAVQRFQFAADMALDGDERARRAVYDCFDPGPVNGESIAVSILRLEGLKSFIFGARKIGQLLLKAPSLVDEGWLWSAAVDMFGEAEALGALRADCHDECLEAYRQAVMSRKMKDGSASKLDELWRLPFSRLRQRLGELKPYQVRSWGKRASQEEIGFAAASLVQTTDLDDQLRYLRIFSGRAYPLEPTFLLELVEARNERLAYAAASALSELRGPQIRDLAFRLVREGHSGRIFAIKTLAQSFEAGDGNIALEWFESEAEPETSHAMERQLLALCADRTNEVPVERISLAVYWLGPCSFCRLNAVENLMAMGSLSATLREECMHDANDEIQQLVHVAQ